MKTLAEQVQLFIDWKSQELGHAVSAAAMAEMVARHQTDLAPEKRCSRQNIESLFDKNLRTTRYVVALAKAMGTTAEILEAGKYSPPSSSDTPTIAAANATALTIDELLAQLGDLLMQSDTGTRAAVADLLVRYAQNPAEGERLAQAIKVLMEGNKKP